MLTVSGVCTCGRCERFGKREIYRMVGRCYNCQAEPVLMLYRAGDTACPLDCPKCGNYQSVHPVRLATDDEIPAAEVVLCASCGRQPGTYENYRGQRLCSGCADGTSPEGAAAVARSVAELGDPLVTADLERFEALFADPDYDGPELPAAQQPEPGDPGVWAIWHGGRIKADHDLTAARCTRWWREHPGGPPAPVLGECGDGYGYGAQTAPRRTVETVAVAGGVL